MAALKDRKELLIQSNMMNIKALLLCIFISAYYVEHIKGFIVFTVSCLWQSATVDDKHMQMDLLWLSRKHKPFCMMFFFFKQKCVVECISKATNFLNNSCNVRLLLNCFALPPYVLYTPY